ncbi:MAG: Dynamin family protein [Desulfobacterales bacterium]|nr:MAG: Dynamin family protein [Desulfobacterales bacterium]
MNREEFISTLRNEIVEMVGKRLSPKAMRYGYSDVPLQTSIQWRPMVLLLGNYSSGKSSLINDFLGAEIQTTGQAPTDDSFTVITRDDTVPPEEGIRVVEERDGQALINDPEYPFTSLKRHGQRFSSHFRIKKVNSPFLKDLALIDTPGMLDSVTGQGRGYEYQEVVADLAQKAGLVLVLFDSHKAGTVREAHESIREILSFSTSEDRVVFVLNRIDECRNFNDLLRVYGTLCWNLSQVTGRKDIPLIRLAYSPRTASEISSAAADGSPSFLPLVENQREHLREMVLETPRKRLDHLAGYYEIQGERLGHYMDALVAWREKTQAHRARRIFTGLLVSLLCASLTVFGLITAGLAGLGISTLGGLGALCGVLIFLLWLMGVQPWLEKRYQADLLDDLDALTPLKEKRRRDSWEAVKDRVRLHMENGGGEYTLSEVRRDRDRIKRSWERTGKEIREIMSNYPSLTPEEMADLAPPILSFDDRDDYFQYLLENDIMDPYRVLAESRRFDA